MPSLRILLALALILLIAFSGGIWFGLPPLIEHLLTQHCGQKQPCNAGLVRVNPFTGHLQLRQIQAGDPRTDGFSVERAEARVRFLGLLQHRLQMDDVVLAGIAVAAGPTQDGWQVGGFTLDRDDLSQLRALFGTGIAPDAERVWQVSARRLELRDSLLYLQPSDQLQIWKVGRLQITEAERDERGWTLGLVAEAQSDAAQLTGQARLRLQPDRLSLWTDLSRATLPATWLQPMTPGLVTNWNATLEPRGEWLLLQEGDDWQLTASQAELTLRNLRHQRESLQTAIGTVQMRLDGLHLQGSSAGLAAGSGQGDLSLQLAHVMDSTQGDVIAGCEQLKSEALNWRLAEGAWSLGASRLNLRHAVLADRAASLPGTRPWLQATEARAETVAWQSDTLQLARLEVLGTTMALERDRDGAWLNLPTRLTPSLPRLVLHQMDLVGDGNRLLYRRGVPGQAPPLTMNLRRMRLEGLDTGNVDQAVYVDLEGDLEPGLLLMLDARVWPGRGPWQGDVRGRIDGLDEHALPASLQPADHRLLLDLEGPLNFALTAHEGRLSGELSQLPGTPVTAVELHGLGQQPWETVIGGLLERAASSK